MKSILIGVLLVVFIGCESETKESIDLLLLNGHVYQNGNFEAVDIAVQGDSIIAVANNLQEIYKAKKTINAENSYILPGLVDAHAHLQGVGQAANNLNFLQDTSWQQLLNKVEQKVAQAEQGEWILGRGWHQEKWTDKPTKVFEGFPSHEQLSAISPNNPVLLSHASGHGILANAKAMELAGISGETQSPIGGYIVKNESGMPIGVFHENAEQLITKVYEQSRASMTAEEQMQEWENVISLAQEQFAKNGVTGVHDAGIPLQNAFLFKDLAEQGDLKIRLYSMLAQADVVKATTEQIQELKDFEHPLYSCRAVKAYADGALGSRGAWLLQDYSDMPGYRGENVTPIDSLRLTAEICKQNGLQLAIHAIGDRGNREVLNIFENVMGGELETARWRIEHAQHLHPQEIERLGRLNVIASMQTVHCTSDAPYVEDRLGEQRAEEGAYVWQTLLANNVHIANGTDAPVERVNPFENMYSAVTRKTANGEAFYPNQTLSRQQAIDSYTIWNAYASFQEDKKGSVEVGKWADFTIVDRNLLTCDEEDIATTKVKYTIVGGDIVFE